MMGRMPSSYGRSVAIAAFVFVFIFSPYAHATNTTAFGINDPFADAIQLWSAVLSSIESIAYQLASALKPHQTLMVEQNPERAASRVNLSMATSTGTTYDATASSRARPPAPTPTQPAPVNATAPAPGQGDDCASGTPIIDLQGNPTLATKTLTHVYAHPMDGGPNPNNECGTYTLYGADPKTFVALDQFYGKDQNGVWFIADPSEEGSPYSYQILGADPATFTLIPDTRFPRNSIEEGFSEFYTTDKTHVFWLGQVLAGADPATFSTVNDP